jgi:hypothetical protein
MKAITKPMVEITNIPMYIGAGFSDTIEIDQMNAPKKNKLPK